MLWADVTWRSCVRAEEEERWFVGRRVCIRTAGLTRARRVHVETELQRHRGAVCSLERASEVAMRRRFSEHVQPAGNFGQVVLR